jgi:methionyl aminopeptidase
VCEFYWNRGGQPAALEYKGFPKGICASIDNEVCHGIPNDSRILQEGSIVKLDVAVKLDGFYGDTAATFAVGKIPLFLKHLVDSTHLCLELAIDRAGPGVHLGDLGHIIWQKAALRGLSVVRDFTGHGVGRNFHEPPVVLHYGTPGTGPVLQVGEVFTLEPMLNLGREEVEMLKDGWTAVTCDGSQSAQFEHTVLITEDGCEILTQTQL